MRQAVIADGLCRSEVNRRVRIIIRCFKWGVENELHPPIGPPRPPGRLGAQEGRSEAKEREPVRPVPDAWVEAVRPHVSRQIWSMIQLQRLTGMRPGEVALMRTCDLDTGGRVWTYTPASHKTEHHDKGRTTYIGPKAQAILRGWLRTSLEEYLFQPREAEAERHAEMRRRRLTPVQPSQRNRRKVVRRRTPGEYFETMAYHHAIRRACLEAGVPTWGPNRLKTSSAVNGYCALIALSGVRSSWAVDEVEVVVELGGR